MIDPADGMEDGSALPANQAKGQGGGTDVDGNVILSLRRFPADSRLVRAAPGRDHGKLLFPTGGQGKHHVLLREGGAGQAPARQEQVGGETLPIPFAGLRCPRQKLHAALSAAADAAAGCREVNPIVR